ncbi:beta-lactamase family protein [Ginsengibacter hankyongi]|uniref:Beta-lactamase family protein n=1 Tax=Ginsengibacter hankyongi TaxID=2607284 RepID=A0A5J5IDL5_9BACT|nr:serine hydrolase domain-containing protein [Ginsengibacter hankyongi]KAA9037246.1 beta-lactamase family protein [Ginsengibacter hankyongi]
MPCRYHISKIVAIGRLLLMAFGILFLKGYAQCPNADKLDSFFSAIAAADKGMGSIAISKNGQVLYCHSIGYRLLNNQRPVTANCETKYRIGSITKMFTAVIIFQLIGEGKLGLLSTLDNYFPGIPNAHLITIEQLLRHRTGLRNFSRQRFGRAPKTHEEMLAIVKSGGTKFLPGLKFDYNNTNYLLLGYIIEKISGKSYETVVNERIISKINLKDIYCGHETSIENNECFSYRFKKRWKQSPVTDMSIPGASGNMVSTPAALTQFMDALFSGRLISFTNLSQMETMTDGYGMGMMKFPYQTKDAFGHTGSIDEFVSVAAHFLQDSLSIAYCSNGQLYPVQNIITRAMDIYFGKAPPICEMKFVISKTKHSKRYTGVYTNKKFPFEIIIRKKQKGLQVGGMGFTSLPLEYVSKNKFRLIAANIDMEFDAHCKGVKVFMGSNSYYLEKK